jgi:hypothetical protein
MNKPVIIVGFPIISKLIRGFTVELSNVIFIPDDQLFNEACNFGSCLMRPTEKTDKPKRAKVKP